jgi:uncharacterized membrane protein YhiD involved in acid resistance
MHPANCDEFPPVHNGVKETMLVEIQWPAIALRVALTIAAGILLGIERCKSAHAAGLRATLLV